MEIMKYNNSNITKVIQIANIEASMLPRCIHTKNVPLLGPPIIAAWLLD